MYQENSNRNHNAKKHLVEASLAKQLLSTRKRIVLSLIIMMILGVSIYMSPLRGNTVAAVGVFAILNTAVITLMATIQVEIINSEEDLNSSVTQARRQQTHEMTSYSAQAGNITYSTQSPHETDMRERNLYFTRIHTTLSSAHTVLHTDLTE